MAQKVVVILACLLAAVVGLVHGEEAAVHLDACPPEAGVTYNCEINEVRIDPCPEAKEKKDCKLKRTHNASISIDFTPQFSTNKLIGQAFWAQSKMSDLPFVGMTDDACLSTQCPIQANVKQTYKYQLQISRMYPVRKFQLKWKLHTEDKQECCTMFKIKIVR